MPRKNRLKIDVKRKTLSLLAIPPSPFSPKFPITPPASSSMSSNISSHKPERFSVQHHDSVKKRKLRVEFSDHLPPIPLEWTWRCCLCRQTYRLGVTRRCLNEGHYFCTGRIVVRSNSETGLERRVVVACKSEFDYKGWRVWAGWRQAIEQAYTAGEWSAVATAPNSDDLNFPTSPLYRPISASESTWDVRHRGGRLRSGLGRSGDRLARKDCWNQCTYPSECQWGDLYGVKTPTLPMTTSIVASSVSSQAVQPSLQVSGVDGQVSTTFEEILSGGCNTTDPKTNAKTNETGMLFPQVQRQLDGTDFEQDLQSEDVISPLEVSIPNPEQVAQSAERRRRRSSGITPSPLSSHPPSPPNTSLGWPKSSVETRSLDATSSTHEPSVTTSPSKQSVKLSSRLSLSTTQSSNDTIFQGLGNDIRRVFQNFRERVVRASRPNSGLSTFSGGIRAYGKQDMRTA